MNPEPPPRCPHCGGKAFYYNRKEETIYCLYCGWLDEQADPNILKTIKVEDLREGWHQQRSAEE